MCVWNLENSLSAAGGEPQRIEFPTVTVDTADRCLDNIGFVAPSLLARLSTQNSANVDRCDRHAAKFIFTIARTISDMSAVEPCLTITALGYVQAVGEKIVKIAESTNASDFYRRVVTAASARLQQLLPLSIYYDFHQYRCYR
jgi:hypothetical protein